MHKQDIVAKIARRTDLDESSSKELLNLVIDEIASGLKKGKSVTLTGFGTLVVRKKKKRKTYSVYSGGIIEIPAHKTVAFVPGAPLKRLVNGK